MAQRVWRLGAAAVIGVGSLTAINAWLNSARRRAATGMGSLSSSGAPPAPAAAVTRDELYAQARRLDIPQRSRMTKDELQRAIAQRTEEVPLA